MLIFSLLLLPALLVGSTSGILFHLEPNSDKCLRDEVHKDVLVTGDYSIVDSPGHKVNIMVTDSRGEVLHKRENFKKGKFTITVEQFDVLQICFRSTVDQQHRNTGPLEVSLELKHGIETKAYEQIAEAEKLKPLEVELRKLEDLAEAVVKDFINMKQAEEEMRDTNESTHQRVLYFSILSVICLLLLATWQVFYLRRYFKSQKLID